MDIVLIALTFSTACLILLVMRRRQKYRRRVDLGMILAPELWAFLEELQQYGEIGDCLLAEAKRSGKFVQFKMIESQSEQLESIVVADIPLAHASKNDLTKITSILSILNQPRSVKKMSGVDFLQITVPQTSRGTNQILDLLFDLLNVEADEIFHLDEISFAYEFRKLD